MTTLADVRARALGPVLYGHVMPEGVLHSLGMAEHPVGSGDADGAGNGYLQALRTLPTARYDIFTAPRVANFGEATYTTGARMTALKADLCQHAAAKITLPGDVTDAVIGYNRGNSFSAQGAVFAPVGTSAPYTAYDFSTELAALKAALGATRRLYAGIGMGNNHLFPAGNFDFNNDYPLQVRKFAANFYAAAALIDQAAEGIDPLKDWISNVSLGNADLVFRDWLAAVYDPTHPDVFDLMISSVGALVTALGTTVEYVCQGETGLTHSNFASDQAPVTHYTDAVVAGFGIWLTQIQGFTLSDLNDRWGTTFDAVGSIDPRDDAFIANGKGLLDYQKWLNFTLREVALQTYHKVKATNAAARGSFSGFGITSMEVGGLQGEFGTAADFYGEAQATYLAQKRYHLQNIAAACRLSGIPGNWHATTPPGTHIASPTPVGGIPPLLWAYFNYTRDQFNWLMRDVLVTGSVHIGYLRTVGFSFRQHADSVTAIYGGMEAIATIRAASLEGMGAYQRYAVHVTDVTSPLHDDSQNAETPSAGVYRKLTEKLRELHIPVAVLSQRRTMERGISQWWLKRSFVVVPYNVDRMELIPEYTALFPDASPGAALFIDETLDMPAGYHLSGAEAVDDAGSLHRIILTNGDLTNCWVFRCRDRRACKSLDDHFAKLANSVESTLRPLIESSIAQSATDPFVVSPLRLTTMANGTDPISQVVTDGLNFTVAVSNMHQTVAGSTTITVDPRLAAAFDVTYPASTVVALNPLETKFVTIEATPAGITLNPAGIIDDAEARLAHADFATYDATIKAAISSLLTKAEALRVAGNEGRALAMYLEAVRTPILKATYAANSVTINARVIGAPGSPAGAAVLVGARVQLVWPLNGREEQAVEGVTLGSGDVAVPVGSPTTPRLNIATKTMDAPLAAARAQCEAHVTDLATGATSKIAFVVS